MTTHTKVSPVFVDVPFSDAIAQESAAVRQAVCHAAPRHFHTFDALRFFAFLKVFLFHIPYAGFGALGFFMAGGALAVRFFFVLSGFLITYLILDEKQRTGTLNLKFFMLRRILRIWPLYFLIVTFALATPFILNSLQVEYSNEGYAPNYLYTYAFLENYVGILKRDAPNVSPLGVIWSICVEEHFYIVWGVALYYLRLRSLPMLIGVSIAVAAVSRWVFVAGSYPTRDLLTNLDLFALGALPAYWLVAEPERLRSWLRRMTPTLQWAVVAVVVLAVIIDPHLRGALHEIIGPTLLGILFTAALCLFLDEGSTFRIAHSSIFSKLGKYTYGLYLYHTIVINLLAVLARRTGLAWEGLPNGFLFVGAALGLTIAISAVSYHVFERPFLALKPYAWRSGSIASAPLRGA